MSAAIKLTFQDGVATVTLNRPEKHNAFDDQVISDLTDAFREVDSDVNTHAMILAAEGKSFSAGADLNWMKRMADYSYKENCEDAQNLAIMLNTLDRLSKPTIARVQGAAYGGAVGLVSCCDIAVGTPAAKFCLSEVKVGLVPATISPYVIAAMGQRAARRYFLTAEVISAESAQALGLLSSVVESDHLDFEMDRLASALLANGANATMETKRLIFDVAGESVTSRLMEHTSSVIAKARVSKEGQQRLSDFLNQRK